MDCALTPFYETLHLLSFGYMGAVSNAQVWHPCPIIMAITSISIISFMVSSFRVIFQDIRVFAHYSYIYFL